MNNTVFVVRQIVNRVFVGDDNILTLLNSKNKPFTYFWGLPTI
jgi:hypothetical protein